jgi:large subunit ribosomal protein L15
MASGDEVAAESIRVTQVRSAIGTKPKHRGTLRALGLRGIGRTRSLPDRPEIRGMLARVPHLVEIDWPVEARGEVMKLHDLRPPAGSNRPRRRVGRGIAGKGGKTAGRGTKGQGARDTIPPGFEGGQLPLAQRVPKLKGFRNPFRVAYAVVNLDTLAKLGTSEVDPERLVGAGLVRKGALVKVLGRGAVEEALTVRAHGFSASARAAIEQAGGSVEVLPMPFGHGRPPARGNALTNR